MSWRDVQALHNRSSCSGKIAKVDLPLDDFALAPLTEQTKARLVETLDDRYDRPSAIVTSQFPLINGMLFWPTPRWLTPSSVA